MPSARQNKNSVNVRKVRAKNSKAQKRYREKKQDEKKELQLFAERVAAELRGAEAQRDALTCDVAHLDLQLRTCSYKMENQPQVNEPIYIPAVDGYSNLRTSERPGLMLRAVYSPPKRWTYAEMMALCVRDFALIRKDIVLKAGKLLLANPHGKSNVPEGVQMKELMKESHGLTAYLAIHRPQVLYMLTDCRMDSKDDLPPTPQTSFWSSILRQLNLSPEQEIALLSHYIQLRDVERKLFAEREHLREALLGHKDICTQQPCLSEGLQHSFDCCHWASLVRRLQENLDKQHMAKSKFHVKCSSLWTMEDEFGPNQEGIDVFQDARLLTLSWPFYPRVIACVEAIAIQNGLENMAYEGDESCANHVCIPDDSLDTPYKPACTRLIEEYMQHRFKLN